jgi:hypothetical protein
MVAASFDPSHWANHRLYLHRHFYCARAIYLYAILIMHGKNYKAKETMLVITVAFLALHLIFHLRIWLYLAVFTGFTGVFSFYLSTKIDRAWTTLSLFLGEINNRILLTVTFFLIVTPVGLIRKLLTRKNLLSPTEKTGSYFSSRDHLYKKEDLEKSW